MPRKKAATKIEKKDRDFGTDRNRMVTLYVEGGKDGSESFAVHEHLLCNASPFFKAALQEDSGDGAQDSLCLREIDYSTLNHLVPWLYSGRLSREAGDLELDSLYWLAVRLNTLALTYEISGLTEEALALVKGRLDDRHTSDKSGALPDVDQIAEIYRKSPASNLMRRFVVDLFGTELPPSWYASGKLVKEYPQKCPEFIVDLFKALGKKTENTEKEMRKNIASWQNNSSTLESSRDRYLRDYNVAQKRVEQLEEYLRYDCDVDARDI